MLKFLDPGRYFIRIDRLGSFRAAVQAISVRLRKLERDIGVRLFG